MTQTTEGTGPGAVPNVYPKILNNVVKNTNIKASNVEQSDLKDGSVTTDKIATGAVTFNKIASGTVARVQGGLKEAGSVITAGKIKVKAEFSTGPDTTTLKISSSDNVNVITLLISYRKITTSTSTTGVINQAASVNTWYTIASVNSDGETIEAFVSDISFHTNYRITMQVRQSDYGYTHLVVEQLVFEEE